MSRKNSRFSFMNTLLGIALGVASVAGLSWLVSAAFAPGPRMPALRILSLEITPLTVLSIVVFCALLFAFLALQGWGRRRAERDLRRQLQRKRKQKQEER